VPHGIEALTETIGTMIIVNDGSGTLESGNYQYEIRDDTAGVAINRGKYKGFPRKERIWRLIQEIFINIDKENLKIDNVG